MLGPHHPLESPRLLTGVRIVALVFFASMVVAGYFAPPPPAQPPPKSISAQQQTDAIPCAGIETRLYGTASEQGGQLAASIIDEFNDVADTPLAAATLARAQLALLNYYQVHPTATLREAVTAIWRTI